MSKEFYETRKIFREYLMYDGPLTFEEWNELPEDNKAAHLYVQFSKQIIDAWYKVKTPAVSEQGGVETICQYLLKNVPVIENNPKRFTEAYIYKVAYNCLYCYCIDRKYAWDIYNLETSNVTYAANGDCIDLFDYVESNEDIENKLDSESIRDQMWEEIESLGDDAVKVAQHLVEGSRIVGVTRNRINEIKDSLSVLLSKYADVYYQ